MGPKGRLQDSNIVEEGLRTDLLSKLLLVQELHGILGDAVSDSGFEGLEVFISAELATLGLKMNLVSPSLYAFDQCDSTFLVHCMRSITSTLAVLDGMVTGDLTADYDQILPTRVASVLVESDNLPEDSHPGLTLLHDVIACLYKTKQMPDSDDPFPSEKLSSYLQFDMTVEDQDCLWENLTSLNQAIDTLVSVTRAKTSKSLRNVETIEEDEEDIVVARQAQEYRRQISNLYQSLARSMDCCEERHMAQLCLTNFGVDKTTLDIYISVCKELDDPGIGSTIAWHPTKCSKRDLSTSGIVASNLCDILNTARARRLPALISYSDGFLTTEATEARRLEQEDLRWSFVDLSTVLDATRNTSAEDSQIGTADKIRLQCLLTQSLLFLHPSFWMPESLELHNIHFTSQGTTLDLKNPYIYCAFQQSAGDYVMPDIATVTDFMIHFGLLLLQIEVGHSLPLSANEEKNQYGHELALARYMQRYETCLRSHIGKVLHECLWFKACLEKIPHPKMALDLKIRYAVSLYILRPLVGSLEFDWPNTAREILPYSMEKRKAPQKHNIKTIAPNHKRTIESADVRRLVAANPVAAVKPSTSPDLSIEGRKKKRLPGSQPVTPQRHESCHHDQSQNGGSLQTRRTMFSLYNHSSDISLPSKRADPAELNERADLSTQARDYTVGWISAIPLEKAIACEMLDEDYPRDMWPWYDTERDHNSYTFGRLHGHNIVVACLHKGRYGTNSAAVVARDMHWTFPNIKIGLLVGIAGGAPSGKHDIRLGDVVVSTPTAHYPGIIQYDYGKALSQHEFEGTGHMTPPSEMLLTSLANLEARHKSKGHQIDEIVEETLAKAKRMKEEYSRPPIQTDRLYKAAYKHSQEGRCECLRLSESVDREARPSNDASGQAIEMTARSTMKAGSPNEVPRIPRAADTDATRIFYGLVASANRLMKDVQARDALIKKYDVLCFEMEAAGIANSFPYVVIRGICDYSDSHKNDLWQGYAAANAAAYARELLSIIPCHVSRDPAVMAR